VAKEMVDGADIFASSHIEKDDIVVGWASIKWYSSYDGVAAIIDFVEDLDGEDLSKYGDDGNISWHEEQFKFIRIGEEQGDIDTRGHGFWDLHPETRISGISF